MNTRCDEFFRDQLPPDTELPLCGVAAGRFTGNRLVYFRAATTDRDSRLVMFGTLEGTTIEAADCHVGSRCHGACLMRVNSSIRVWEQSLAVKFAASKVPDS